MENKEYIVAYSDPVLVTGSNGFIGSRVVAALLGYGFTNLQCLVRPSSDLTALREVIEAHPAAQVEVVRGNLLSREDCDALTGSAEVIFHLAAGRGEKSFANAYLNSVVTTRNLLEGAARHGVLKRFVNMSSFSVYSNWKLRRGALLDETCDIETGPDARGEAYCFAKVRQEQMVVEQCTKHGIPYVMLRPGVVYGPGNKGIHGRIGIGTFGIFLHLGRGNRMPLSYVDNCADAVARAGIIRGVDNEVFNVVDDDLPTSREFLAMYKREVRRFRSLSVPYAVFYEFCRVWEYYSAWSKGQLPPTFNRKMCSNYWKGNRYSNAKMKELLKWRPVVNTQEAAARYCEYQRAIGAKR